MTKTTEGLKVCHSRRSGLPLVAGGPPARNSPAVSDTERAEAQHVGVRGSCSAESGTKILERCVGTCGS